MTPLSAAEMALDAASRAIISAARAHRSALRRGDMLAADTAEGLMDHAITLRDRALEQIAAGRNTPIANPGDR